MAIDALELARDHNTLSVLMDVAALPSWVFSLNENNRLIEEDGVPSLQQSSKTFKNQPFLDKISFLSKKYILIFAESTGEVGADLKTGFNRSLESVVLRNIEMSFQSRVEGLSEAHEFVLLDLKDDDSLRCLMSVSKDNQSNIVVFKMAGNLGEWVLKHKEEECFNCDSELTKLLSVLIILGCSCFLVTLVFGMAALVRYQLRKKRISKGPYKVLLTATDFVFPQLADSRRVSIFLWVFSSFSRFGWRRVL